jgi:hypothetical protein
VPGGRHQAPDTRHQADSERQFIETQFIETQFIETQFIETQFKFN